MTHAQRPLRLRIRPDAAAPLVRFVTAFFEVGYLYRYSYWMPRAKLSQAVRERGQALGDEVRRVRSESAMSAEQVAVEAALSVETIRRIEQGRIPNPGVFTIAAIAAALDVGLAGLVEAATARGESR